jgi:type II secretory pathway pseudopilin PulG
MTRITRRRAQRGFTLIEAALTTVIVGVGVLSIVAAQQAYHRQNQWAKRSGTGMLLANELREVMATLPLRDPVTNANTIGPEENKPTQYDDVDDFTDAHIGAGTEGPSAQPMTGLGQRADSLANWSQKVQVEPVAHNDIATPIENPRNADMARVTVTVLYEGPKLDERSEETVAQLSWIVTP